MRRLIAVIILLFVCSMAFAGGLYIPPDVAKDPDIMWTVRGCPASQTIIDRLGAYGISSANILCADVAGSLANLTGRSATAQAGDLAVQGVGGAAIATLTGSGIALTPGTLITSGIRNVSASLPGRSASSIAGNLGVSGLGGATAILAGSYGQMSAGTIGVAGQRNVSASLTSAGSHANPGSLSIATGSTNTLAPVFKTYAETTWSTTTTTLDTGTFNVTAGDVLVAYSVNESQGGLTPTIGGTLSAVWSAAQYTNNTGYTKLALYTGTTNTTQNGVYASFIDPQGNTHGGGVYVFSSSSGTGLSGVASGATGNPTVSITGVSANSAIVLVNGDWNATSGGRTYSSSGTGTITEKTVAQVTDHYSVYGGYYPSVTSAGTKTVGMTAPTGQKWTLAAVEVKGAAGGGGGANFFDDFERTGPELGSNWTSLAGNFSINAYATASSQPSKAYYNGASYNANMYVVGKISTTLNKDAELLLRMSDNGNDYYAVHQDIWTDEEDNYAEVFIIKSVGGTRTILGADFGDIGGWFRLEANGTTFTLRHSDTGTGVSASWTILGTRTDSSISAGGRGGINTTTVGGVTIDDFGVGDL